MIMAVKTIYELFDIIYNDIFLDLAISGTDINGDDQTIITSDDAKKYIIQKYATRKYPVLLGASASLSDAKRSFQETYSLYLTNHLHGINKQMQALFDYNYSPIENVDRYETESTSGEHSTDTENTKTLDTENTVTHGKIETNSGTDTTQYGHILTASGSDTIRDSGNDSLTKDGTIEREQKKAGYNAPNSYTNDTLDTESYTDYTESTAYGKTETTTHGKTDTNSGSDSLTYGHTITNSGSDTSADSGTVTDNGTETCNTSSERELHVHGNIGVTTNTQLINDELELRKISLAEMILDDIINSYTYYS